jgi:hypothetical protein
MAAGSSDSTQWVEALDPVSIQSPRQRGFRLVTPQNSLFLKAAVKFAKIDLCRLVFQRVG